MENVFGRERELKVLQNIWDSGEAEFLALYGRRRVGKTFLISEFFSAQKGIYFEVTGAKDGNMKEQLRNFIDAFSKCFYKGVSLQIPKNWHGAFKLLTDEMEKQSKNTKIILFFDELPWLATKRSRLLQAIDHYWNTVWSRNKNIRLVVCGSAASWVLKNIINARGGLHNRVTYKLHLQPYNLNQAKSFLHSRGIKLSNKQILDIYMVTGGIPFYLKQIKKGRSCVQNINDMCFDTNGILFTEFEDLFKSLFDAHEANLTIVREIAKKRTGISRTKLLEQLDMKSGAYFNKKIEELVAAGFIQKFVPYGKRAKNQYYRIIDEYTTFYIKWIKPLTANPRMIRKQYWQYVSQTPTYKTWAGYAFEEICYKHINQIAHALDLDHVGWLAGTWKIDDVDGGAQVDLLFDRDDGIIMLGEIKCRNKQFVIEKCIPCPSFICWRL